MAAFFGDCAHGERGEERTFDSTPWSNQERLRGDHASQTADRHKDRSPFGGERLLERTRQAAGGVHD
jgi:hypothetical protein